MNWQPPDSFHLQAAAGWLELGHWREIDFSPAHADTSRHVHNPDLAFLISHV